MEVKLCKVYYKKELAGLLIKNEDGTFLFKYLAEYLSGPNASPISISLPIQKEAYVSNRLFAFFEGLISEGWLKKIQSVNQKIDENDLFGLLEQNGKDLIGAVTLESAQGANL